MRKKILASTRHLKNEKDELQNKLTQILKLDRRLEDVEKTIVKKRSNMLEIQETLDSRLGQIEDFETIEYGVDLKRGVEVFCEPSQQSECKTFDDILKRSKENGLRKPEANGQQKMKNIIMEINLTKKKIAVGGAKVENQIKMNKIRASELLKTVEKEKEIILDMTHNLLVCNRQI